MENGENQALLPAGLQDTLAPNAAHEVALLEALVATFGSHGYDRVSPPLVEFETTLVGGGGPGMDKHVFRFLDPASQRMMALRADMTPQVARIAATRLRNTPRPLRLSYGGPVLNVRSSQLRPERQFAQAGVELIGVDSVAADAEILLLGIESLAQIGINQPAIDLNSPALVAAVLAELDLENGSNEALRAALDHKDVAAVTAIGGPAAETLRDLILATGPADTALPKLNAMDLPPLAAAEIARIEAVIAITTARRPELKLTIDPVEYRGFEYQTGISFTLFLEGVRGEIGRGGRYVTTADEPATGLTIYLDTVCRAVPAPSATARAYLPHGTPIDIADKLRRDGWVTVAGLAAEANSHDEARRLGCTHIVAPASATPIEL